MSAGKPSPAPAVNTVRILPEEKAMNNFSVTKRDGEVAEFNLNKISNAIKKAFNATEQLYNDDIINLLALRVTSAFQSKIKDGCVNVEDI